MDPRVAAIAPPWLQLRSAIRLHDWRAAARRPRLPPSAGLDRRGRPRVDRRDRLGDLLRAARLSRRVPRLSPALRRRLRARRRERVAHARARRARGGLPQDERDGEPGARSSVFHVWGLGFGREVSAPVLRAACRSCDRQFGTRLDVLVCGALVGLGFAAEENLGYLHQGDLSTAMARFLTANFFHMSMTAILAGALDSATNARSSNDDGSLQFSQALLTVAAMHGIYDFCLSEHGYEHFVLLDDGLLPPHRRFLALVSEARRRRKHAANPGRSRDVRARDGDRGRLELRLRERARRTRDALLRRRGLLGLAVIIYLFVNELPVEARYDVPRGQRGVRPQALRRAGPISRGRALLPERRRSAPARGDGANDPARE